MARRTSLVFGILTAVLAGWAGYLWLAAAPAGAAFRVEEVECSLGECPVGPRSLTFRVTNQSDRPREILGLAEG